LVHMALRHRNVRIVLARAPVRGANVYLGVHHNTTRPMVASGRLAGLGDYVGLIYGMGILENPVAIFQGLNRPFFGGSLDASVYAYINKPHTSFTFAISGPHAPPTPIAAPADSVFVSFVTLAKDVVDDVRATLPGETIGGAILYWEWTLADAMVPHLPDGYQTRYRRPVWQRP
jgi:hypothetical protein